MLQCRIAGAINISQTDHYTKSRSLDNRNFFSEPGPGAVTFGWSGLDSPHAARSVGPGSIVVTCFSTFRAMFCPRCLTEYREGFTECADCHVALVPAVGTEAQDSRLDFVPVFESNDRFTIGLAKGSLEDAGIPFWTRDEEAAARLALGPIMFPSCQFLVPKDREAEARELLESLDSPLGEES